MNKQIIASILIPTLLLQVIGCYSENIITKDELNKNNDEKIRIITNEGKEYECESNFWFAKNDTLFLNSYIISERKINQQRISLISVKEIYASKYDGVKTFLFLASVVSIAIIIAALTIKDESHLNFPQIPNPHLFP